MILSYKTTDPNMKFHNNPFSRFYVNREQLLRETHGNLHTGKHTYRHFVKGVFVHILTLLETCATKIGMI